MGSTGIRPRRNVTLRLASEKRCGDMGGKVVSPASELISKLKAARLAADVMNVPTILIARIDAYGARLLSSTVDELDRPFVQGEMRKDGFYNYTGGVDAAISRGLVYAPYADVVLYETSEPSVDEAKRFAQAIHGKYPGKPLGFNCSPAAKWRQLDSETLRGFQDRLGVLGYKLQYVSLGGFHILNYFTYIIAKDYAERGVGAFKELRALEVDAVDKGYSGHHHIDEVGTEYFDTVRSIIDRDSASISVASPARSSFFRKVDSSLAKIEKETPLGA